jgi:hypothetical protein
MRVYRYLNEEFALDAIQENRLKMGRLFELNDPADCNPVLVGGPDQKSDEANEIFAKKYFEELPFDVGVLCFSETVSDPVIWSHYADSHKGIAVGYDIPEFGSVVNLTKVEYKEERPVIDYADAESMRTGLDPFAFMHKVVHHGFRHKAPSWGYEKEHRIFLALDSGLIKMHGAHYFLHNMRPDVVVLGLRCRLTVKDIRRALRHQDGITIGRAHSHKTTHTLVVK